MKGREGEKKGKTNAEEDRKKWRSRKRRKGVVRKEEGGEWIRKIGQKHKDEAARREEERKNNS